MARLDGLMRLSSSGDGAEGVGAIVPLVAGKRKTRPAWSATRRTVPEVGGLVLWPLACAVATDVDVGPARDGVEATGGAAMGVTVAADRVSGGDRDVGNAPEHATSAAPKRQTMTTTRTTTIG